jgi:hypothetical protein
LEALGSIFKKQLLFLLLVLASIAGALFTIFTFLATMSFGRATGLALYLLVNALLIGGYMVGFMVLAFLAILFLTKYWSGRSK